jgi:hypothetical protein
MKIRKTATYELDQNAYLKASWWNSLDAAHYEEIPGLETEMVDDPDRGEGLLAGPSDRPQVKVIKHTMENAIKIELHDLEKKCITEGDLLALEVDVKYERVDD